MEKHKPLIIGIVVLIVLVALVLLIGVRPGEEVPEPGTTSELPPPPSLDRGPSITGTEGALPNQTPEARIEEGELPIEVIYTSAGYSPAELEIAQGTVVVFKNLSSMHMWPASDPHETHDAYPTFGGCIGSTFDACTGIRANDSWSFRFETPGTWRYHDHLSPARVGTVIVR